MDGPEVKTVFYQSRFSQEVLLRKKLIDPYNSEDWYSLALGWAIAKGISPEEAHEFAKLIRYYTDLKQK